MHFSIKIFWLGTIKFNRKVYSIRDIHVNVPQCNNRPSSVTLSEKRTEYSLSLGYSLITASARVSYDFSKSVYPITLLHLNQNFKKSQV